jgi:biopolymer transport protein ExbD
MRRRSRRGAGGLPQDVNINVTSLVDLAFTLLVIFMITAPMMQGGIEVDIPKADVQNLTDADEPLYITIMRGGEIFLEETPVTADEVDAGLPQLLAPGNVERVYVRADSLAPYGIVLRVIAAIKNSAADMSLVAEPYRP